MNHRLKALASATLVAIAMLPAAAAGMDLTQAYREALAIDPVLASARAQLEATRERVPQARSGLLPAVNANFSASRQAVDSSLRDDRYYVNPKNYALQLSQPLVRLQNLETYAQSKLSVSIGEAQLSQAQQDLIVRVSQAYFDVLAAQDNVETIRAQKRAITEQLASAKRNFEVGTATITDQQEAQARFDLASAQEIAADNDLRTKRIALDQLVGRTGVSPRGLSVPVALPPTQPADAEAWTTQADSQHPAVRKARTALEIARLESERARAGKLPTVDAVGSVGLSRSAGSSASLPGNTRSASVGVQLNWPLYTGESVENRIRETVLLEEKSRQDVEAARRAVAQATRQAFFGVQSGQAQVKALEAAESSTKLALEATQLGYRVGVRVNLDVLNAQTQLFQTQRDLAKARYDVIVGSLRLRQASGQLRPQDLQAINALLQRTP